MTEFHIEFEGKAARLPLQSLRRTKTERPLERRTPTGIIGTRRIFSGVSALDAHTLTPASIKEGDPELDLLRGGQLIDGSQLTPAFLDHEGRVVPDFEEVEVVFDAKGVEQDRRARLNRKPNINDLYPVKVARMMPLEQVLTTFVFRTTYQLVHEDGIGYEFLHRVASKLHKDGVAALLGAGPKGNQPLVFKAKGSPFRAFLYGEIGNGDEADKYRLLLLLSNQELKMPDNAG